MDLGVRDIIRIWFLVIFGFCRFLCWFYFWRYILCFCKMIFIFLGVYFIRRVIIVEILFFF